MLKMGLEKVEEEWACFTPQSMVHTQKAYLGPQPQITIFLSSLFFIFIFFI